MQYPDAETLFPVSWLWNALISSRFLARTCPLLSLLLSFVPSWNLRKYDPILKQFLVGFLHLVNVYFCNVLYFASR